MDLQGFVARDITGFETHDVKCQCFSKPEKASQVLTENWKSVVVGGGALFLMNRFPELIDEFIPGTSIVVQRYDGAPRSEIWHLSKCPFGLSYEIATTPSFSNWRIEKEPTMRAEELCLRIAKENPLGLFQVGAEFLVISFVDQSMMLSDEVINEVLDLNRRSFGLRESERETSDRVANWKAKRFFSIGNM